MCDLLLEILSDMQSIASFILLSQILCMVYSYVSYLNSKFAMLLQETIQNMMSNDLNFLYENVPRILYMIIWSAIKLVNSVKSFSATNLLAKIWFVFARKGCLHP